MEEQQEQQYVMEKVRCQYLDLHFGKTVRNGNENHLEVLLKVEKTTLNPAAIMCPAYKKDGRCSLFRDVGPQFHLSEDNGEYDCIFKRGWQPLPKKPEETPEKVNRRF